jgi:G3E family GTPase
MCASRPRARQFGEVGIDDALLAKSARVQSEEHVIEMMNGCICCTVRACASQTPARPPSRHLPSAASLPMPQVRTDLIEVLTKLATRIKAGALHLDGIVIETTGMADPAPVAQTFFVDYAVKAFARLDGIVTLVDAKHIEQHLDEQKPEGAENEAIEQVAFADRILLNKTDLVSEADLERVEARIKSINPFAPVQRCQHSAVDVGSVLNIQGFDLQRTLRMDPEFLNTDGEHVHDQAVTSLGLHEERPVNVDLLRDWMSNHLLPNQGQQLYRMKGVIAGAGCDKKVRVRRRGAERSAAAAPPPALPAPLPAPPPAPPPPPETDAASQRIC